MRVLVCGGRTFGDTRTEYLFIRKELDTVRHEIGVDHVIEGGARGVDRSARSWAEDNKVPFTEYPADWQKYGKSAGYVRNQMMLHDGRPDLVVAFPGGPGTEMMVKLAYDSGVSVRRVSIGIS